MAHEQPAVLPGTPLTDLPPGGPSPTLGAVRAVSAFAIGSLVLLGCSTGVPAVFGTSSNAPVAIQVADSDLPAEDVHAELMRNSDGFPSARQCAPCHQNIYDEWSTSAHSYSGISPMFHRFEQALNTLASGTVAAFCVRCHLPVGTAAGQPRHMTMFERSLDTERFKDPLVSIEGITCIVCHRVGESYGRVNGNRWIEPGTMFDPVYGTSDGSGMDQVLADPTAYGVAPDQETFEQSQRDQAPLTRLHSGGVHTNSELQKSQFCVSCHQVAVHPGIKLEVVWDQYLNSPAAEQDISCQDCHMGKNPGKWQDGYDRAHRATVAGEGIGELVQHGDHSFVGPGYSIAHPGIFPHHPQGLKKPEDIHDPDAQGFTFEEWVQFDWRQPWGEQEFEDDLAAGRVTEEFPEPWRERSKRVSARAIVRDNQARLDARDERRRQVMENGSHIDGPYFASDLAVGQDLVFHYEVTNTCEGHNLPSGSLGAQPQVWLNVALVGPDGTNLWESGYLDSTGDLADIHSVEVLRGDVEFDDQLFNLQTKFLTTNLKGTDREMYLPVPFDADQLPFIRPAGQPTTVLNHPPTIRMEQRSIPPLRMRRAEYEVPGELLTQPGTYRLAVRMRSRAEPIYFMSFVGATQEMIRTMNERMVDIHPYTVEFEVR
jgi:hypothetical protein